MKSNLAWHSGLFTSDLPTAKILLKIWRGFGSLGWAAAAQLKLFCLRKLINDCCHERWRGNLGSSARCWGRWAKPFRRGDLHHFTLLGDRTLGHSDPTENQSELRFFSGCSCQVLSPSFFLWVQQSFGLLCSGCWGWPHLALLCRGMEWEWSHSQKKWEHFKRLWSVQPRKDCRDRYWQISKSNIKEEGNKCLCLEEKEQ